MVKQEQLLTVLLPVYNDERYIDEAIQSILDQTFKNFELIIINDGSSDGSLEIIKKYAVVDERIRVYSQENRGLIFTLNKGIDLAKGKYLIRSDADDICMPARFERQFNFMENHPAVDICGTGMEIFGQGNRELLPSYLDHESIKCGLFFRTQIAHATVIMRRDSILAAGLYYDPSYKYVEDYELWVRASKTLRFANMNEVLYRYRRYPEQITQNHQDISYDNQLKIRRTLVEQLGIHPTKEEAELHQSMCLNLTSPTSAYFKQISRWLLYIQDANSRYGIYPEQQFSILIGDEWFRICRKGTFIGPKTACNYIFSPLSKSGKVDLLQKFYFYLSCFLFKGRGNLAHMRKLLSKLSH